MEYINEELYEKNFNFKFCATTYNNVSIGIEAFQRFVLTNRDFFNYDKGKFLFGHLLTYSIERAFNIAAFSPASGYNVILGQLNEYGYNGLYIKTDDCILTLAKTMKELTLPCKANYKLRLSKCNSSTDIQISLNMLNGTNIACVDTMYAIIAYGYRNDALSHLNVLVPSSDYKSINYGKNILENASVYKNIIPEEAREEQIVTLKQKLLDEAGDSVGSGK